MTIPEKIVLAQKLAQITEHWSPRIAGELNGQHVKLAKFQGEFIWHAHANEDELFLVVEGSFDMHFREGVVTLHAGEVLIVPRGVEHRPVAAHEVSVLLFEPAGTLNTGTAGGDRTIVDPLRI
jgi:mannose-6-phosphate isomerase-like protein (cupin superfamily)